MNSSGYPHDSRRRNFRRNILPNREQPGKFDLRNLTRIPGNSINTKDENLTWQPRNMPT
jgi:hypothetical protein